ncbi:uncharacterized protein LOC121253424 [Juglans microcarpa x Juglans regia]|uniref:uncharacterized protein LOC121253424 n=1 Tax=Juglans microcarpa x Juglans regia TaxID=2249226 RepID=UPI001B7E151D|nr:uncharacterized protein LOC121253424 [Juglans microcarpa x Juglans regia]
MGTKLNFSIAFHPQTDGQSERTIQILEDKLRACMLDFKGTWIRHLPEIIQKTTEKIETIRSRLRAAQSRQKSYADNRRRQLEFEVGNKVFLRIAPMRGVMRFGKKGKLSPRYVRPFEILDRIGPVAYRVTPPPALSGVHDVFHVSMLRKYIPDPTHIIDYEPLQLQENLTYTEESMQIIERKEQVLRKRTIPLVKVVWNNHAISEASWE